MPTVPQITIEALALERAIAIKFGTYGDAWQAFMLELVRVTPNKHPLNKYARRNADNCKLSVPSRVQLVTVEPAGPDGSAEYDSSEECDHFVARLSADERALWELRMMGTKMQDTGHDKKVYRRIMRSLRAKVVGCPALRIFLASSKRAPK